MRHRIFGFITVGSATVSICSFSVVLYIAESGVKSAVVVFVAFRVK